ncbi:EamA family transporter [Shimwellia pseudoproteus]|uniref:DMT family transporter n=1 Tax=Shimwellia pseudoproteus TaxID=570012 RepID=UPI0018EBBDAA|nr:EamA family transporter [Shimwellia pseudoproteus]MBJ3816122.1 EamA family transporter [Shimwellia pseudoproteus]
MRLSDYLRLLTLAALWGASFLFMRIIAPEFGALNSAFLRVLFGALGLAAVLACLPSPVSFAGKFRPALLLGVINSGVPFFMYCLAAKWVPAGYSAIFNATTPLMGAIIGCGLFGERLTPRKWLGVLLGLGGIVVIVLPGGGHIPANILAGAVACLTATSCYALAGFLTRRWISDRGGLDPNILAFGSQLGATLFLLPFFGGSLVSGPAIPWWQGEIWGAVIALGLLCTALAYRLYFRLIADIGPLRTLTVTFLIPPFALLWGYLVLGETLNSRFIGGATVVGIAVWLIVSGGQLARTRPG